jgi:hypothetical protein
VIWAVSYLREEIFTRFKPYIAYYLEKGSDKLRPNDGKSRKYDRVLYTFILTVIRRFGRDKDRGITPIKTGTVRFGPRVFNQVYLVCVKGGIG